MSFQAKFKKVLIGGFSSGGDSFQADYGLRSPCLLLPPQVVASDGVRAMMESALTARDRVGVQDFVLLENYTSEAAFIENLRKRFKENLIYVSGILKRLLGSGWASRATLEGFSRSLTPAFPNLRVFSPPRRTSGRCWCR